MLTLENRGGKGRPLVLIHGFLGSGDDWQTVIPRLSQWYRCYTLNISGFLNMTQGSEEDAFRQISDKVHDLLVGNRLIPVSLLGYSLGGRIALAYANYYPGTVERLFLEGANPGLQSEEEKKSRLASDRAWAQRFVNESLTEVLKDWYQQTVFSSLECEQRHALVRERSSNRNGQKGSDLAALLEQLSLGYQPDWSRVPGRLAAEVVYLVGEYDQKFLAIAGQLEKAGNVHKAIVAGAGHNTHRDNPEGFIKSLSCATLGSCRSLV